MNGHRCTLVPWMFAPQAMMSFEWRNCSGSVPYAVAEARVEAGGSGGGADGAVKTGRAEAMEEAAVHA